MQTLYSHTIRKVKFLSKNSILIKPKHFHEFFTQIFFDNFSREIKVVNSLKVQNHNIFTSFSPKIFLTIFLVKSKLSTAKKSTSFHPKEFYNFSRKIKVEFLDKNEDFEQCEKGKKKRGQQKLIVSLWKCKIKCPFCF